MIDVPVYLRVAAENPGLTPFAYLGPQGSFEMRCDGGGSGMSIEGRYVYGLIDLHLSTVTTIENYRTRSFMLPAGVGF